ncbi:hypothetical protein M758_1G328000 [Ceratodon purpureus]|uniref:Uncharacterized protein n=1 Tax=Ceratodon purpureus TaxID=3225 RepID=A0A8T0JEH6_CERPU|nr:hypothetical protein KC19_1G335500 [Ceratodon purpureus]KAG0632429.1 hypothetical protein M758_1G328000 [Ceratodon purpureus]
MAARKPQNVLELNFSRNMKNFGDNFTLWTLKEEWKRPTQPNRRAHQDHQSLTMYTIGMHIQALNSATAFLKRDDTLE